MITYKPLPATARRHELLAYDPQTGVLTWRKLRPGLGKVGSVAGLTKKRGHLEVKIDGIRYQAHRLIWKMMTGNDPAHQIDHRDGNPGNNRRSNLRSATNIQNLRNRGPLQRSFTRIKGVSPRFVGRAAENGQQGRTIRAWRAQIKHKGRVIFLGEFRKPEVARLSYDIAAFLYHGNFAYLNGKGLITDTGSEDLPRLGEGEVACLDRWEMQGLDQPCIPKRNPRQS